MLISTNLGIPTINRLKCDIHCKIGILSQNGHIILRAHPALVDDRTYEKIRISDQNYEIRLKYLGLNISLASIPGDSEFLISLMSGVLGQDDILDSFIARIPLGVIAASSTAAFDAEEQAWVRI